MMSLLVYFSFVFVSAVYRPVVQHSVGCGTGHSYSSSRHRSFRIPRERGKGISNNHEQVRILERVRVLLKALEFALVYRKFVINGYIYSELGFN